MNYVNWQREANTTLCQSENAMRRRFMIAAAVMCFLAAAMATVFPVLSNYYTEKHRSEIRTEYFQTVEALDTSELEAARKAAQEYNVMIANGVIQNDAPFSDGNINSAMQGYTELLNINEDGIMAYIDIPKLGIYLPVGHSTEAETLDHQIGHVIGISLPVGGESTHAVLSGHSGLATEKMFSDLDQLTEGDIFLIHVLNETLAYTVDQINVVLPGDTSLLPVVEGKDYVTLITCTPFGVNSHRLLVRGERTEYVPPEDSAESPEQTHAPAAASTWTSQYIRGLLSGAAILVAVVVGGMLWQHIRRKRGRHE